MGAEEDDLPILVLVEERRRLAHRVAVGGIREGPERVADGALHAGR
jgi:hypothetical protein